MAKYVRSGQYELVKMVILTNTSNPIELDISASFMDAVIYESIFDGTMSGNVSFVDTNNTVQRYGLGRGETVTITWYTTGIEGSPITVVGTVYDCQGPMPLGDQAGGFTLHFASPEFIASMQQKLFSGHTDSCSAIVEAIIKKVGRQAPAKAKPLLATPTRNIEHIVFSGQTPTRGIDMCSRRAVSTTNMSGYLFYENNQEFRFAPVEELYEQEPIAEYAFRSNASYDDVDNAYEESFNTFQDFEIEEPNKFIDDIHDGQYGSAHGFLSIMDKSMTVHTYNAKDKFDPTKSLGKNAMSLNQGFNEQNSDRVSLHYRSSKQENESSVVDNGLKLLKSNSFAVNIGTFGNSALKVGLTMKASVPSNSSESLTPGGHDNISGKFLIAEIKHILTPKIYNARMKIIKDAYEEVIS